METTKRVIIYVAFVLIAFLLGWYLNTGIEPKKEEFTSEEIFLLNNALLPGIEGSDQKFRGRTLTATQFFKDAAYQKLLLNARALGVENLDAWHERYGIDSLIVERLNEVDKGVDPEERKLSLEEIASLRKEFQLTASIDSNYEDRLKIIFNRLEEIGGINSSGQFIATSRNTFNEDDDSDDLSANAAWFRPCPCPRVEWGSSTAYCPWAKEDIVEIIVDTAIWDVVKIDISKIDGTNETLLTSSTQNSNNPFFQNGSTFVLYKLPAIDQALLNTNSDTTIEFKIRWLDDQGIPQETKLYMVFEDSVSSNN